MKKLLLLFGIAIIIVVVVLASRGDAPVESESEMSPEPSVMEESMPTQSPDDTSVPSAPVATTEPTPLGTPVSESHVREFVIEGKNFEYSMDAISVKRGDTVRIVFKNVGGFHDMVMEGYDARTPRIDTGETATIEFVANQAGSFAYYCSVGNHRQLGMEGILTVTE